MDERLNQSVEDACLNACPALKEAFYDGWLIRLSEGHPRRTNSVNVVGRSREWLRAQARFAGRPLRRNDIRKRLLDLVALPVAFAARRDAAGRIVSVAYGAVHDRLVSLQWVVTDPAQRGGATHAPPSRR